MRAVKESQGDLQRHDGPHHQLRVFHPIIRKRRQLLHVPLFIAIQHWFTNSIRLGKRLGKNIAGNKKDVIKEFRDKLKQLRDAFINETTVEIGTNVLRVLGHVKVIGENLEDHSM